MRWQARRQGRYSIALCMNANMSARFLSLIVGLLCWPSARPGQATERFGKRSAVFHGKNDGARTPLVRERRAGRSRTIRLLVEPLLPTDRGVRGDLNRLEAERKWSQSILQRDVPGLTSIVVQRNACGPGTSDRSASSSLVSWSDVKTLRSAAALSLRTAALAARSSARSAICSPKSCAGLPASWSA